MSPTGSDSVAGNFGTVGALYAARILPLCPKAGIILVGSGLLAYRYRESTEQLTITNCDGAVVFPALSGADARTALAEIQSLPHA
jgi:hypothetical protein